MLLVLFEGAVSALVSRGRPVTGTVVPPWQDAAGGAHVLAPCGRCRELLRALPQGDVATRADLGRGHMVRLRDVLPSPGWHAEPV